MQILNMLLYTGIVLGVLVFIHELGHFLAAKLTGMRVDRFSIGFPPRAFGKKVGDTDYCVSWVPLGGYVKIAGMVDESMDTEFIEHEPQPWEFRSKPISSRIFVISAGVIMNILLAIMIFWWIHYERGTYLEETTEVGYVAEGSALDHAGLRAGDKILSVNNTPLHHWEEVQNVIYIDNLGNDLSMKVDRGGTDIWISVAARDRRGAQSPQSDIGVAFTKAIVEDVIANMPAEQLGLKGGDTLLTLNGKAVSWPAIVSAINRNAGKEIALTWKRDSTTMSGTTTVTKDGFIGMHVGGLYVGPSRQINYTIPQAFGEALQEIRQSVGLFALTIGKIFSGKATVKESFGGPIAIAQMATQSAESGFLVFIWFMAQLSMSLAILNILPIPALDGGHLLMLIIEKIIRREIPHKVKLAIQQAGFILLLAFMAFIIYNDISRF
ncbi:MAG TPA: RIP metalloprotease RseP [Bacteroidota bacterium]|nr:RIP metalloprotease RseP [Bacteroidota bacterium]